MSRRKRKGQPLHVGKVLDEMLDQVGLSDCMANQKLLDVWPQVVGEKIARFSRAVDFNDGVLVLQAEHPVWRQELTMIVPGIITKYNDIFGAGTVKEVRWSRQVPKRRLSDNSS